MVFFGGHLTNSLDIYTFWHMCPAAVLVFFHADLIFQHYRKIALNVQPPGAECSNVGEFWLGQDI